jgi:hypothetical protein
MHNTAAGDSSGIGATPTKPTLDTTSVVTTKS